METPLHLQQQRQAHGHLGGGDRQYEQVHDLSVRGRKARPTGDEGQRRGVQHHFQGHEHKQQVAPQQQAAETAAEQQRRHGEDVLQWHGNRAHGAPPVGPRREAPGDVVGTDQRRQQQHGGNLHGEHVGAVQGEAHGLGRHRRAGETRIAVLHGHQQLNQENTGDQPGGNPADAVEPGALALHPGGAQVQHHHHEHEQHHDGTGVDEHLQRRGKGCAEQKEQHRHREQGQDEPDQAVGGVGARQGEQRGGNGDRAAQ